MLWNDIAYQANERNAFFLVLNVMQMNERQQIDFFLPLFTRQHFHNRHSLRKLKLNTV